MTNYNQLALAVFLLAAGDNALAFQPASRQHAVSKTQLQAMPPMIISGAIKKYKAEQEKKKMPMATKEEASEEAPGLRVGSSVWKWPPVWPYDREFFMPPEDIPKKQPNMNEMASMMSGIQQTPEQIAAAAPSVEEQEEAKLDVVKFWSEEKGDARTNMDEEAIEQLKKHYAFYMEDGASILELGAAENSYLPDDFKTSRHVGVGLNQKLMDENPALTDTMIVDLNNVVEDRDVDDDNFRTLAQEPFDVVIMANTVEFLTSPREVLRSAWYMLKPGGQMFIAFSGKDSSFTSEFERASTKVWRDYNDDQHMWICGSIFEFSAGDGWENLRGFDISPESAKEMSTTDNPLERLMKQGKANNVFVVQAVKGTQDDSLDVDDLEKSINSKMWMMPIVEPRDKSLVIPRLVRSIESTEGETKEHVMGAVENNIGILPKVYEALIKMDQFSFTFSMQAQLAADLITNPDFNANDEQLIALKQGLGLRKPSKEFWEPIGQYTSQMDVEDKINLLGYVVPCFGSNDDAQEKALQDFATGLAPTMSLVRSKCAGLSEQDVQLIATEFLAAEILKPGKSTREEFAKWLGAMTEEEMKTPLVTRQQLRRASKEELDAYKKEEADAKAALEEKRKEYQELVKTARKNRSMVINGRTGKFEEYKP